MPATRPVDQRFREKFEHRGGHECWPWTAATNASGYGVFMFAGRSTLAHRLAWALQHKVDLPAREKVVMHSCDNRLCVNPAHLRLGTAAENGLDMVAKGRQRGAPGDKNAMRKYPHKALGGENNGNARLTWDLVLAIRSAAKEIGPQPGRYVALAAKFNVSKWTIRALVTRKGYWDETRACTKTARAAIAGHFNGQQRVGVYIRLQPHIYELLRRERIERHMTMSMIMLEALATRMVNVRKIQPTNGNSASGV